MSAHTPGPWVVNPLVGTYQVAGAADHNALRMAQLAAVGKTKFSALSVGVDGHDGAQIAIIPLDESNERNARLIAAAPDMLAALKALTSNPHLDLGDQIYVVRDRELQGWDGPAVKASSDAVTAANAAIAKAEGTP